MSKDFWPNLKVGEKFSSEHTKKPCSVVLTKSADACNIDQRLSTVKVDRSNPLDIADIIDVQRFNSLNRLLRVTALVIRF